MIYEALLAIDLPEELGPPLPTPWSEGLERLLLRGRFRRREARVEASGAWVLARCHAALHAQGFSVRAVADVDEVEVVVAPSSWDEAPVWAEVLPEAWTRDPADFVLDALRVRAGLAAAVRVRHAVRRPAGEPAVVAALRLAVCPDGDDELRLDATARAVSPGLLQSCLDGHGERLADALSSALGDALEGEGAWHGGAKVLVGPLRAHAERLRGLPAPARALLERLDPPLGRWPASDGRGVEGRVCDGVFEPLAEVQHAL